MRAVDRILSLVLGLVGLALGALVAVEVVAALAGKPPVLLPYSAVATWLRGQPWSGGPVLTIGGVLLGLGLVLLLAELKRRRRTHLVLGPRDGQVTVTVSTRTLAHLLEQVAAGTPGVDRASARVHRRRARLTVQVPVRSGQDAAGIAEAARARAAEALVTLQLRSTPRLTMRTHREAA